MEADLAQAFTNVFATAVSVVRDTKLDLVQLLSNVAVGAASAWIAGRFGVRHGLQRAKREKAFELSLEWYKNTVRSLHRFVRSASSMTSISGKLRAENVNRAKRLEEATSELISSLEESSLFAERKIVRKLRDAIIDLEGVKVSAGSYDIWREAASLIRDLRALEILLSNVVRDELGLEKISADDLKSTYEAEEEELKKAGV